MRRDYLIFRQLLDKAIRKILWLYFETPVAGQKKGAIRERLFCYELYHQLRCICDTSDFGYWLGGELDKIDHPIIRGKYKPDLVIHEPGDEDRNLCVVEVKPITGNARGFKKDIATLTAFVTQYSYHAGILLVFGDLESGESVIRKKVETDVGLLRQKNIFVIWVKSAQSKVVELD